MIIDLLVYILCACWLVIMVFYIITLIALAMIEKMFHVKQRKGKKNGQSENSNNIKTNDTEHNQFEESEEHNFKLH